MKTENMNAYLDEITLNTFGRSRTLALAGRSCVICGKPATEFRDELSAKEFSISGMCQVCQDNFFVDCEE